MLFGSTVLGWVLALAIDGTIITAFAVSTFFALRRTHAYLQRHEVGDFATGVAIFVTFCCLFVGGWLPVGAVLGGRWLLRRA